MKYRYHRDNSRKGYVHLMYDLFGEATALDLASKVGIADITAKSWVNRWNLRYDLAPSMRRSRELGA